MNLHDIQPNEYPSFIFMSLAAYGGNGRHLGNHVWRVSLRQDMYPRPAEPMNDANIREWSRWVHQQLYWTGTFGVPSIEQRVPWIAPLCGARSAARSARTQPTDLSCNDCLRIARDMGARVIGRTAWNDEFVATRAVEYAHQRRAFRGY